jgi:solute carrier family 6 amino acid transporter-like protein 5/7/9/14
VLVVMLCSSCFLLSLPCVTNGGTYVFQIMDDYGGGMTIMWVAIIEMIFIMWIYGARNINRDLNFMLKTDATLCGKINNWILIFLWLVIPVLLCVILGVSLWSWEAPFYSDSKGAINYPWYVHGIGIFLILIALLQIPLVGFAICVYYALSPTRRLIDVFLAAPNWGPGDPAAFKEYQLAKRKKDLLDKKSVIPSLRGHINPVSNDLFYSHPATGSGHSSN